MLQEALQYRHAGRNNMKVAYLPDTNPPYLVRIVERNGSYYVYPLKRIDIREHKSPKFIFEKHYTAKYTYKPYEDEDAYYAPTAGMVERVKRFAPHMLHRTLENPPEEFDELISCYNTKQTAEKRASQIPDTVAVPMFRARNKDKPSGYCVVDKKNILIKLDTYEKNIMENPKVRIHLRKDRHLGIKKDYSFNQNIRILAKAVKKFGYRHAMAMLNALYVMNKHTDWEGELERMKEWMEREYESRENPSNVRIPISRDRHLGIKKDYSFNQNIRLLAKAVKSYGYVPVMRRLNAIYVMQKNTDWSSELQRMKDWLKKTYGVSNYRTYVNPSVFGIDIGDIYKKGKGLYKRHKKTIGRIARGAVRVAEKVPMLMNETVNPVGYAHGDGETFEGELRVIQTGRHEFTVEVERNGEWKPIEGMIDVPMEIVAEFFENFSSAFDKIDIPNFSYEKEV